jgi:hypothetical protein
MLQVVATEIEEEREILYVTTASFPGHHSNLSDHSTLCNVYTWKVFPVRREAHHHEAMGE